VWDASEAVRRTAAWYRIQCEEPSAARRLVDDDLHAYASDAARKGLVWTAQTRDRAE
jgi:hypothetical protein